ALPTPMPEAHPPRPGGGIDRRGNVLSPNSAARAGAGPPPRDPAGPPLNVFRACLHPEGLARRTRNFPEWSAYLLDQLHRLTTLTGDADLEALANEVERYPNILERNQWHQVPPEEPALGIPSPVELGGDELSLFTTLTTFGTPQDITLAEAAVELFYPADDATDAALRGVQTR